MNVLLTGFDPFGGEPVNPALEAVKKLDGLLLAGARVHTVEIPTVRGKAIARVKDAIAAFNPDIVICIGQAGGRTDLTVERVAINCDDFRIGDNEGNQPVDEPVVPGGPAAYFATLPIKKWWPPSRPEVSRPRFPTLREPLCATMCSTASWTCWPTTAGSAGAASSTCPTCRNRRPG